MIAVGSRAENWLMVLLNGAVSLSQSNGGESTNKKISFSSMTIYLFGITIKIMELFLPI